MKKLMIAALAGSVLLAAATAAGCANKTAATVPFETVANGSYMGFDAIPDGYTPDEAAVDGCMVIVANKDDGSELYAGINVFDDFLSDCKQGDAFMRVAYFLGNGCYYNDLIYKDGKYCYIDSERPDDITFYSKLRELKTVTGSTEREYTYFVLTDSNELTADDVLWSFLSSNLNTITDISFKWLGFTVYLNDTDKNTANSVNAIVYDDYSQFNRMEYSGVNSAIIYKNPQTCESVANIDGEYYTLGVGFGGYGLCDVKEYGGYLIFTYSFGSGLHRSHVGVLELATGEIVFTSDPFPNIDVMLNDGVNGVFGIYLANIRIGNDFCELSLTKGEKLAVLTVSGNGISFKTADECSTDELEALVSEICDNTDIAYSSNPYDYINARREAFDALVAKGDTAVEYFVEVLRASDTFGLDEFVMSVVCAEVTGIGADGGWSNAGEWLAFYNSLDS